MSDIIEGIGGLAEGGLAARAVEPGHGGPAPAGAKGHFHESACLNCETPLTGHFCHSCGQQAHLHKTVGAFLHDLLHGVLHFEGKTWRTLPLLASKPGKLTRDYIDGHRARYVSPMALFLFSIFLMFAVFQASGISPPVDIDPTRIADTEGAKESLDQTRARLAEEQARVERELAALPADDPRRAGLEGELEGFRTGADFVGPGSEATLAGAENWSIKAIRTGSPFVDHLIEKWQKNPSLMLYKMQANSYKFSWLLIPLSLPFMALIFAWRRRFGLYDHAVFVTYSLSFMTLLFVVITVLAQVKVPGGALATAATLVPIWHIYRQLRGAYTLSRFSALWRTAMLCGFITVILLLFLNLLVLIGAF